LSTIFSSGGLSVIVLYIKRYIYIYYDKFTIRTDCPIETRNIRSRSEVKEMVELQGPHPEVISVLLVEDNAADARLIGALLDDASAPSFELMHVTQLSRLPEVLSRRRFDVILLDLSLPDAYGLDTVMRARSMSPNTPIVVLSNMGDEDTAVKTVQIGAQDYLFKGSVDTNLLVRSIRYAIERKKTETIREALLDELDQHVKERTKDLLLTNERLQREIEERKRAEQMVRESEQQLRSLSYQLMATQEMERKRISRELHDELGQSLTIIKMRLRFIQENLMSDQIVLKEECENSMLYINEVIEDMRRLSQDLSPAVLEDLGLTVALRWVIGNFTKNSAIKITHDIMNIDQLLPVDSQIILYRILQETLTNIGKHSDATHVSVVVREQDGDINFSVEDDGKGFDMEPSLTERTTPMGLGLKTMDERVRMLGGTLRVWSQKGKGARITFSIPAGYSGEQA
jgi:signal transduction histidine kinase